MGSKAGAHCAPLNARRCREKILLAKRPRNPLKSLDSDERIQGNPRKSNTDQRSLRSETATRQKNPNWSFRPSSPRPRPVERLADEPAQHAARGDETVARKRELCGVAP